MKHAVASVPEGAILPSPGIHNPSLDLQAALSGLGDAFIENKGQLRDPGVLYYLRGDGILVGFEVSRVRFALLDRRQASSPSVDVPVDTATASSFTLELRGSAPVPPAGLRDIGHPMRFYRRADPQAWVEGARGYAEVVYREVYPQTDMRFRFSEGRLKYEFVLGASADPSDIVMEYEGIQGLRLDTSTGEMVISVGGGQLRDERPVVIEGNGTAERRTPAGFKLLGGTSFGFSLPGSCGRGQPMVIDPGLVFSTYLGGSEYDSLCAVDAAPSGDVLVTGSTLSYDFPQMPGGAHVPVTEDIVVARLTASLDDVSFSTLVQGSGAESGMCIRALTDGGAVVAGGTRAHDLPCTGGALDASHNGGNMDGFLLKLDDEGSLVYCTYFGGDGEDVITALEVDASGDVLLAGCTSSSDLPTTPGALSRVYQGSSSAVDALFVLRIDGALSTIVSCTYLNHYLPSVSFSDWPRPDLAVEAATSNVLIAGITEVQHIPVDEEAYQPRIKGGHDGIIVRLDPALSAVLNFTHLGGSQDDEVRAIATGADGSVYVCGWTESDDFPNTTTCVPASDFNNQAFVARFDADLSQLESSKVFGGSANEYAAAIVLDADAGSVITLGQTQSGDMPCTPGCIDPAFGEGARLFLVTINSSSEGIDYCSYLGGAGIHQGLFFVNTIHHRSLAMGGSDHVLVAGYTRATDLLTTPGAVCPLFRGGEHDGFVMVIDPRPGAPPSAPTGVRAIGGEGLVQISWDPPPFESIRVVGHRLLRGESPDAMDRSFYANGSLNSTLDRDVVPGRTYYYRVMAVNSAGESGPSDTVKAMPFGRPSAPLGLVVTSENGTVTLAWRPPGTDGGFPILYYEVLRGSLDDTLRPYLSTAEPAVTDGFAVVNETYVYGVRAVNRLGKGALATVEVTVRASPSSAPRDVLVVAGDGQVTLSWLPPASDGGVSLEGYRVYRGQVPDIGRMAPRMDVSRDTLYFTDTGLMNGVRYYYYLTAVTGLSESASSAVVSEVPFGRPGYPVGLIAKHGDRKVTLTWQPPLDPNGREVEAFRVYAGRSPMNLVLIGEALGVTYTHSGLRNGVPYFYEVSAVNIAGESLVRSNTAEATPMGRPGRLIGMSAELLGEGVLVTWLAPIDMGGATEVVYRVYRLPSTEPMLPLAEVGDGLEYLDSIVSVGVRYTYRVVAVNGEGEGEGTEVVIDIIRHPGAVTGFNITYGLGLVNLTWGPPLLDGGSAIQDYYIWRGLSPDSLVEMYSTSDLHFMDVDVRSNRLYYYSVQAQNTKERGPMSDVLAITPLDLPGRCGNLTAVYTDGRVVLSWSPPPAEGRAPVTGYVLYRGTSPTDIAQLAVLGPVPGYSDADLVRGTKYYYSVVAVSGIGPGERTADLEVSTGTSKDTGALLITILILLVLGIAIVAMFAIARRRVDVVAAESGAQTTAAGAVTVAPNHVVEEIFVVYRDGRLMATCAREECRTIDADLMSGMLIAVQGIIQDGLQRGGELESIKYGENLILMVSGPYVNIAVVIYGEPDRELREALESTVQRLETSYAGVLEDWTGDLSIISGMEGIVAPLIERTSGVSRDEVKGVMTAQGVSVLSAVDFYHGYVRLKVAAVNTTPTMVADASIEVEYDHDMLRLERAEPETLALRGDSVPMGNIKPGERKTVAFFFDPQICQGTHIDGMLTYVDPAGERSRVEMKRRHADIVCPIFFTREHANTAMLRELIAEKLKATDMKVLRYPKELSPEVMLAMGKAAVGSNAVQLVREYTVKGPPFYAEVWYYGETKVHRQQMVIRLGVIEEKRAVELFAASTAMEQLTGLLAELRRELDKVIGEGQRAPSRLELERGEEIRREFEERELLLDIIFDDGEQGEDTR